MIMEIIHPFEDSEVEDQFPLSDIGEIDDDFTDEEDVEEWEDGNNAEQDDTSSVSDWLPPATPEDHQFYAFTTYVDRECVIYLRETSAKETLQSINEALAAYYEDYEPNETITDWTVGEPCIAYDRDYGSYLRTRIVKVDKENSVCTVQYIDYGNIEKYAFEDLRKGTPTHHIPSLAYRCRLFNTKPVGGTWAKQAVDYIHDNMIGRECNIGIMGDLKDEILSIDMIIGRWYMLESLPVDLFEICATRPHS